MSIAIVLLEVIQQNNPSAKVPPTYAALDDQSIADFTTPSMPQQQDQSRREEVKLEITAIAGVNSVRGWRVNGLHIQDIYNLFIYLFLFFNVQFGYLQEKITAGQEDIATPENRGLGNI